VLRCLDPQALHGILLAILLYFLIFHYSYISVIDDEADRKSSGVGPVHIKGACQGTAMPQFMDPRRTTMKSQRTTALSRSATYHPALPATLATGRARRSCHSRSPPSHSSLVPFHRHLGDGVSRLNRSAEFLLGGLPRIRLLYFTLAAVLCSGLPLHSRLTASQT